MKKLFLLLVFFVQFLSNSQNNFTRVSYKVELAFDEGFSKNKDLSEYYKIAQENSKFLDFELVFNQNQSFFYKVDNLNLEINNTNFALAFSNYRGKIIQDLNYNFTQIQFDGKTYLIKEQRSFKWELSNETKEIDGYLCYKATSSYEVINKVGVFSHPVIAWYCPSLPFSYGPNGYGGLPGLIFELQERNVVFGVKNIIFDNVKVDIPKFELETSITRDEFDKLKEN